MIAMLLDKYIIYVLMGGAAVCGIVSKLVVSVSLKRLVKASGNMNKSTHPLMRLVRAKFEHACMISERVENVGVFVDKYLYEYRAAGFKLHSLRRMERAASGICLILGVSGAALSYARSGMQDQVIRMGALGAGLAILVFLVHLMTDEGYRLNMARNYMVDYLENICMHRYEKTYQKELKVMAPEAPVPDFGRVSEEKGKGIPERHGNVQEPIRPRPGREVPSPETPPEITPPAMPEPYEAPDTAPSVLAAEKVEKAGPDAADILAEAVKATRPVRSEKKEKQPDVAKDILIRQILEEFMA